MVDKHVFIIRHAKSSWSDPLTTDHDRPLDDRGLHDAPKMADLLKRTGYTIDKIVSSSANRARTTAGFFAEVNGQEVTLERSLYHGDPEDYLEMLSLQDDSIHNPAFFGHNPGITHIANIVSNDFIDNIPTCGILVCSVKDGVKWSDIQWGDLILKHIFTPKQNK